VNPKRAHFLFLLIALQAACGGGGGGGGDQSSSTSSSSSTAATASTTATTSTATAASSPSASASNDSGGFAGTVTGGGSATPVVVSTAAQMQAAINAYAGSGGLVVRYTGVFDFATIPDACAQWQKPAGTIVEIKNKRDITIEGADGSAANFGIAIKADASNIVVRNMTIGLLPGSIDAIGMEGLGGFYPSNIWIDHNTLFSSLAECPGAGDLEFDGLVDNKAGVHHVTYSYNHLHDHHKVGLIGSSDSDIGDRFITFHHNVYQDVGSRLPLQRGGYTHLYNNLYSGVTASGANIRMGGYSLVEGNWFENARNPVTSRDSSAIGFWELRNNNIRTPADFTTYGITWSASSSSPSRDATDWVTTATFPIAISYAYTLQDPACVKQKLAALAGAGKALGTLVCD
jgi:pectate lyase